MSDPKTEDHADEMAEQLDTLDGHIDEARKKLQGPKEAAGITTDVDEGKGDDDERADEEYASPT